MCIGGTAPNPVLTGLKYFRDEFIEHIVDKKCRAGVCASLFYAPCVNACPAEVDVSRYIAYMGDGKLKEAYLVHMENNPFPSVCSRVCPAFCERPCERGKFDEPIAIREVKRLFSDWANEVNFQFHLQIIQKRESCNYWFRPSWIKLCFLFNKVRI